MPPRRYNHSQYSFPTKYERAYIEVDREVPVPRKGDRIEVSVKRSSGSKRKIEATIKKVVSYRDILQRYYVEFVAYVDVDKNINKPIPKHIRKSIPVHKYRNGKYIKQEAQ